MSEPSDPVRLSQDTGAGPLRDWMRDGELDLPSDEQLARLAQRLEPTFATPIQGPASPLGASVPKLLLGALGIAGVAVLALTLRGSRETQREAPKAATATVALSVTSPSETPEAPSPTPAAPSAALAEEIHSAPSATADSPTANRAARKAAAPSEAALLEQARSALANDPTRALALTRQHEARFPNGVLKQEREVIAIEALRRLGRGKAASERVGAFEKEFPDSAHRRAVESGRSK